MTTLNMRISGLLVLALGVLGRVQGAKGTAAEVGSVAAADDELGAPGSHNPPDFCHNLDCPDFEVLKDYGNGVQLRRYVPSMWAMTDVNETLYEKASAVGFQRLSRYILGNDNLEAKIEQTTPVVTEVYLNMDDEFTEQYLVAFYLPWKYQPAVNKDNKQAKVPEPKDDRVIIADEPWALVYVLPFGSYAQGSKVKKLAIDFYDFLDQQGITNYERSTFMVAVYDKPYKPFNRHNEIWVLTW
ncbi:regulatory factor, effector binding domain-containing protein [Haematococcus lacustris]